MVGFCPVDVWFLHWRFQGRMRMSSVVTFTPVPHEECSSRTRSGDYIGSILNIFPWPFISLSLHLSGSGFHSNAFVSVPTSFLSTLFTRKGREQHSSGVPSSFTSVSGLMCWKSTVV